MIARLVFWLGLAALALLPAQAMAQPSSVAPGAIERSATPPPAPRADQSLDIPSPTGATPPPEAANIRFTIQRAEIDGATALSREALAPAYQKLLGREASLADLYAAANAITALYVAQGFALSFAVVPAQRISAGVVHIQMVEGFVADIRFEGAAANASDRLRAYGEKIKMSRPLRVDDLERYLLLANDLGGWQVSATFDRMENAERGATRLIITADHRPVRGEASLNNRGSRAFGPMLFDGQVSLNGLLGNGDELKLHLLNALPLNEMTYLSGDLREPVGNNGTVLDLSVSYSRANPGLASLRSVDFRSNGVTARAGLEYPLWRTRAASLWLSGGLTAKYFHGDVLHSANSRDELYALSAGATFLGHDSGGLTMLDMRLNQGLGTTGAGNPLASRMTGSGYFTDAILTATRLQRLAPQIDLMISATVQGASRALLSPEQCAYGGATFGRGFDDSEIQGDSCAMGSLELRYTPAADIFAGSPLALLQPYLFVDAGKTWKQAILSGENCTDAAQSAGLGLRVGLENGFSGSLEFAQPIGRDVAQEGNRNGRVFFSLSKNF